MRLGVVSNGSDDGNARSLLEKGKSLDFFESVLTSAAFGRRKPDPAIFHAALSHFGASPEQSVMIGDNYDADIAGAQAVGMNTIWIRRRVAMPPSLAVVAPGEKASALAEIPPLVL